MTRRQGKNLWHECNEPQCHKIIPISERYCAKHKAMHEQSWQAKKADYRRSKLAMAIKANKSKEYDKKQRDPKAVAFYHSKQWQAVRDYVYARDLATCQVCGNVVQDRKIVDADCVHPSKHWTVETYGHCVTSVTLGRQS